MRDLVLRLDEVELFRHRGEVGEAGLAHGKQALDDELHAAINLALVQHIPQPLEYRVQPLRRQRVQARAALLGECDRDLHRHVRGFFEQQHEELEREDLVGDVVVHQVGDELGQRQAGLFVVPSVRATELQNHTPQEKFANLGELGVDHCHERRERRCIARASQLCTHERFHQEPASAHHVVLEELREHLADVCCIHLVHDTIEATAQRLPCLALGSDAV
mmetsp:Transcript_11773/g.49600  ORF Transcript_11773/g.49600 Transcript_11773/m.49600 type:complete len:220 (-) Transcript_11773:332-991(-)